MLGSGLGQVAVELNPEKDLPYEEIPFFPVSRVKGHEGKLLLCHVAGKTVLVLQGRFHYYEGYTMRGVTFPIRALARLGVTEVILTNAAGGLNRSYRSGDFMLIDDHINLMGDNPLIGPADEELGPRFVDMKDAYDRDLLKSAEEIGRKLELPVRKGVLAAVSGPTYETGAEARFLAGVGADAVTMSTVPETIVARYLAMRVLGISCITNSLWDKKETEHANVLSTSKGAAAGLAEWLREIITSN